MKVWVSRGWKVDQVFGSGVLTEPKKPTSIRIATSNSDQTFALTVELEDPVAPDHVLCIQSALFFVQCDGSRRCRVHTWVAPTTQNIDDIMHSVDVEAMTTLLSDAALEKSLVNSDLQKGRNYLRERCQQIIQAGHLQKYQTMQSLSLYILGMLKSLAFKGGSDVDLDRRAYELNRIGNLEVSRVSTYFRPRMIALHNIACCRLVDDSGNTKLDDLLPLTHRSLTHEGIYLLYGGENLLVWLGKSVDPQVLEALFGVPSLEALDASTAHSILGTRENPLSTSVADVLRFIRASYPSSFSKLTVLRSGDPTEAMFFESLIEDPTASMQVGYAEFLQSFGDRPLAT